MDNKLVKTFLIVLAIIGLLALIGFLAMGIMMSEMMGL